MSERNERKETEITFTAVPVYLHARTRCRVCRVVSELSAIRHIRHDSPANVADIDDRDVQLWCPASYGRCEANSAARRSSVLIPSNSASNCVSVVKLTDQVSQPPPMLHR